MILFLTLDDLPETENPRVKPIDLDGEFESMDEWIDLIDSVYSDSPRRNVKVISPSGVWILLGASPVRIPGSKSDWFLYWLRGGRHCSLKDVVWKIKK